jgi:ribosomal protein L11 methyltransferase
MKYQVAVFNISCADDLLQVARDLIAAAAGEAGFEAFEETPEGLKGYVQNDLLDKQLLDDNIAEIDLPDFSVAYTIKDAEYKNWNEQWEEAGFDPIDIDGKVTIYDANRYTADSVPAGSTALPIFIQARQAFGTGTHQTTQMIISEMLAIDLIGKHVLDCGCGTGILGITASKLGADEVVGYDIDEWSVANSQHNAELNQVNNIQILEGDAKVINHICGLFDVVLANINRNILLNDMPAWKEVLNFEGMLIMSGFYEDDASMLIETAEHLGFQLIDKRTLSSWACLVFKLTKA